MKAEKRMNENTPAGRITTAAGENIKGPIDAR